jgi:O-acetylserine/cysteine efflux transporter
VTHATPPWRHLLLALAVVAVWGTNFVVIKMALAHLPPLLFAALRFALAFFPAVLFLPRPAASVRNLVAYGLLIGVGQFAVLYIAMKGNITPGLASLVIQTQVFFTIVLAMQVARERVRPYQWLALLLGAAGIAVIGAHTDGNTSGLGLLMVLAAAFSWACANMVSKRAGSINMLSYVVWSSAAAVPPLVALSLLFEGWPAIEAGLRHADALTWWAVAWQAVGNTLFGYAAWGWLLSRHAAASITPMALLVPVFGMATASLMLAEPLPGWKLGAAALVLCGLGLNMLWPRVRGRFASARSD